MKRRRKRVSRRGGRRDELSWVEGSFPDLELSNKLRVREVFSESLLLKRKGNDSTLRVWKTERKRRTSMFLIIDI